jgi:SSS family solute:Na+ symporter
LRSTLPILVISVAFALGGLAYAFFGGLRAIAISDTYNGVALLVMGLAVTFFALHAVGWDLSGIPAERWTLIGADDSDIPWHTLLTGMAFIHIFYWGTNMVIAQRAMAAKSAREAQKGIYAAIGFKLVMPLVVVFPGVIAFKLYGDVGDVAYGRLVGRRAAGVAVRRVRGDDRGRGAVQLQLLPELGRGPVHLRLPHRKRQPRTPT